MCTCARLLCMPSSSTATLFMAVALCADAASQPTLIRSAGSGRVQQRKGPGPPQHQGSPASCTYVCMWSRRGVPWLSPPPFPNDDEAHLEQVGRVQRRVALPRVVGGRQLPEAGTGQTRSRIRTKIRIRIRARIRTKSQGSVSGPKAKDQDQDQKPRIRIRVRTRSRIRIRVRTRTGSRSRIRSSPGGLRSKRRRVADVAGAHACAGALAA